MGKGGYTSTNPMYKTVTRIELVPCTCGRTRRDLKDCARLREEEGATFFGIGAHVSASPHSTVVCLRPSCKGKWRTNAKALEKMPRIWYADYRKLKQMDQPAETNSGQ